MQKVGIFVTDKLADEAKSILSSYDVFEREASDDVLSECQVLMAWPLRAPKDLLVKMKGLRMIQTISAGVDALDFAAIRPGVAVFSNAGAFTDSVAEHGWGILLGIAKGLHSRRKKVVSRTLRRKTLLVVGCGAIGSEIAKLSRSLEMKTVGVSRSFSSPELFDERHPLGDLDSVIGSADAVAIALPLTKSTRGVFGYGTLIRAREDVCMVNVGRGETVHEEGLIRWLTERPESRYATDVFWKSSEGAGGARVLSGDGRETFDTKAWGLPNFAGTFHTSPVPAGDNLSGPMVDAAKNVRRFLETGEASNRVDPAEYLPNFRDTRP
jgi:phosphoglycerate dehydrogenase-like enzyme